MKHLTLIAVFFLSAFALQAQTEKGTFALGLHNFSPSGVLGNSTLLSHTNLLGISFGTQKEQIDGKTGDDEIKYSTVGLNLNGHYFLIDNFSVGIGANFFTQTVKADDGADEDKITTTLFMAGPELRYYFNVSTKTKVFINGFASFGSANTKIEGEEDEDPTKITEFGGILGLAFFPNTNISIDLGVGYDVFTAKSDSDFLGNPVEVKDIYSGLTFDIGFGLFF